jgi:REP element-mobilizing transposase RayT
MRLTEYDYSQPGSYFLTLCTNSRQCLFGEITDGEIKLSQTGRIVTDCWESIPSHFPDASLDVYTIMPNHVHGIITLSGNKRASHDLPLQNRQKPGASHSSIPAIIGLFKSSVTRHINDMQLANSTHPKIWQRNYYEHVIRNETELNSIREYIQHNAAGWAEDENNPANFFHLQ